MHMGKISKNVKGHCSQHCWYLPRSFASSAHPFPAADCWLLRLTAASFSRELLLAKWELRQVGDYFPHQGANHSQWLTQCSGIQSCSFVSGGTNTLWQFVLLLSQCRRQHPCLAASSALFCFPHSLSPRSTPSINYMNAISYFRLCFQRAWLQTVMQRNGVVSNGSRDLLTCFGLVSCL